VYSYHHGTSNRFANMYVLQPFTHTIPVRVIYLLGEGTLSVVISMKLLSYDHIYISDSCCVM
jgi:hypothetical protein